MEFVKAHGTGNDFVVVEDLADHYQLTPELVRAVCDRHFGVGADGLIRIAPGTELLRTRVAERVAAMAEAGLVEEVRRLAERPLSRTARQALGYKELLDAMEQDTPVAEALEAVVRRTRAYARRQLAWFRRDPRVRWSTLPPGPERVALALELLGKG